MTITVMVEVSCDLMAPGCEGEAEAGRTRREATRLARSQGWKIGRRSGSKPRYDICPSCQRRPLEES
jgi:hypothetical protein